nr:MAG: hypothetical protein DIU80_14390 [Chloroflexota bacterium]
MHPPRRRASRCARGRRSPRRPSRCAARPPATSSTCRPRPCPAVRCGWPSRRRHGSPPATAARRSASRSAVASGSQASGRRGWWRPTAAP